MDLFHIASIVIIFFNHLQISSSGYRFLIQIQRLCNMNTNNR